MEKLKVTPDNLKDISSDILEIIESFNTEITNITNSVGEINVAWEGYDADTYINEISNYYLQDLNNLKDCIEAFSNCLKDAGDQYLLMDTKTNKIFDKIGV